MTNLFSVSVAQHEVGSFNVCMDILVLMNILQYSHLVQIKNLAYIAYKTRTKSHTISEVCSVHSLSLSVKVAFDSIFYNCIAGEPSRLFSNNRQ